MKTLTEEEKEKDYIEYLKKISTFTSCWFLEVKKC